MLQSLLSCFLTSYLYFCVFTCFPFHKPFVFVFILHHVLVNISWIFISVFSVSFWFYSSLHMFTEQTTWVLNSLARNIKDYFYDSNLNLMQNYKSNERYNSSQKIRRLKWKAQTLNLNYQNFFVNFEFFSSKLFCCLSFDKYLPIKNLDNKMFLCELWAWKKYFSLKFRFNIYWSVSQKNTFFLE